MTIKNAFGRANARMPTPTGGGHQTPTPFPLSRCADFDAAGGAPSTHDETPKHPPISDRWPHGWWIIPGAIVGIALWRGCLEALLQISALIGVL